MVVFLPFVVGVLLSSHAMEVDTVVGLVRNQFGPVVTADGSGGVVIAWQDYRSNSDYDSYSQRLNEAGTAQWAANGVVVSSAAGNQISPSLVANGAQSSARLAADDAGGAIAVWKDYRNAGSADLYAQRINRYGAGMWGADGMVVTSATGEQSAPTIVADGAGGAILVWEDHRSGEVDIYAPGVSAGGGQ